jgi:hypothetical protein
MMDEHKVGTRQTPSDETTTGSTTSGAAAQTIGDTTTTTTTGDTSDQTTGDTTTTTTGDTKTRPYNLIFAIVCVAAAVAAYLLTMWLFRGLIKNPEDAAIVSGALGVLFTLIGTVAGAYFAVKSTQDTADKAAKRVEEEAKRTERANQAARSTSGKG